MEELNRISQKMEELEKKARDAQEENKRLREELDNIRGMDSIKYMFPSKEILDFEEIAEMTKENPMHMKNYFLNEPDTFTRHYVRDFYAEAVNIGNSLRLLGIKADGSTYHNSVKYLIGFIRNFPKITHTEEFATEYPKMVKELEKYIEMEDKLTSSRIHIVRRTIGVMSIFAYWLHVKSKIGQEVEYDPMIIHPTVAGRLDEGIGEEEVEEEPMEEKADDLHDPCSELLEDKQPPKKQGIMDKVKDLAEKHLYGSVEGELEHKPKETVVYEDDEEEDEEVEEDGEDEAPDEK